MPSCRTFSARAAESCALHAALTHRPSHVGCARIVVGLLLLACTAKFSFAQEFENREFFETRAAKHERHAGTREAEPRAERHARADHNRRHHHTNTTTATTTTPTPRTTTNPTPRTTTPPTPTTATTTPTTTTAAPTTTPKSRPPASGSTDPYWDINGSTVGAGGATPSGTWSTTVANWNPLADGTGTTANWVNGNDAVFSAGTDATGAFTATVSGSVTANSITFEEGTVSLAGTATPVLTIAGGGVTINQGINGTTTFGSTLGNVTLSASQSWANNSEQAFNIASGVVASTTTRTLTLNGSGSGGTTFSGVLGDGTGTLALTVNTTRGVTTLTGANTYTGATNVSAGILNIQNATALGTTAAGTTVSSGGTLQIQGGITVGAEALTLNGIGTTGQNGALVNVSGNNTYGGLITLGSASTISSDTSGNTLALSNTGIITGATFGLSLTGAGDGSIDSIIGTSTGGLTKSGAGTWTLTGVSTYTGNTTVNGGTLSLTGIPQTTGLINSSSRLVLGGGTISLNFAGKGDQAFSGVTINSGASSLVTSGGGSGNGNKFSLTLNAITRNTGGTVDFTIGGNVGAHSTTTANAFFAGGQQTILGGYATFGANTWAVSGSGATAGDISGLASGSYSSGASAFTATKDVDATLTSYTPGAMTINSLRFNTGASAVNTTGNLTIATGGILETTAVGANAVSINNNNLTSGNGQDLIVIQNNTSGNMTIGSTIVNNGTIGLTKSGGGTLLLTGTNTYTGATTINAGTLSVGALANGGTNSNIGASTNAATNLVFNGGTLKYTGAAQNTDRLFSVGANGGTIDASGSGALNFTNTGSMAFNGQTGPRTLTLTGTNTGNNTLAAMIGDNSGPTSLTKSGAGTWVLSGANTYSGTTTISGGTLQVGGGGTTGTLGSGAVIDNAALSFNRTNAMTVSNTISGSGTVTQAGSGTTTLTGANTYTGATTINAGTLSLDNNNTSTARLANTSGITVSSGGTLLFAQSGGTASTDRIGNSVPVTLNGGGTINTGGLSEGTRPTNSSTLNGSAGMGALTLASTSSVSRATIDFVTGANGSTLAFSSLVGGNGAFLDVKDWTGMPFTDNSASGNDRLLFAANPGLTAAQLANVRFFDDSGTFIGAGEIIAYGNMFELCAVPEPSTWVAGTLALATLLYMQLRKRSLATAAARRPGRAGRAGDAGSARESFRSCRI
jgi:fibronectin-binding autotransporter adhesin